MMRPLRFSRVKMTGKERILGKKKKFLGLMRVKKRRRKTPIQLLGTDQ